MIDIDYIPWLTPNEQYEVMMFCKEDLQGVFNNKDDPMVIIVVIVNMR